MLPAKTSNAKVWAIGISGNPTSLRLEFATHALSAALFAANAVASPNIVIPAVAALAKIAFSVAPATAPATGDTKLAPAPIAKRSVVRFNGSLT